ncbi:ATP-dependent DNA helicase [soil metagenome]
MTRTYEIAAPSDQAPVEIVLDESQQRVVDHPGGPLLVLAGPGTGKTTTLVETVIDRIERRGLRPDQVLVLTFSRKAADDLKTRIAARLRRTVAVTPAMTFHSFCYALVREFQDGEAYASPLRLMSAAEQDVVIKELVAGSLLDDVDAWPAKFRPALATRGFARELQAIMARAQSLGMTPDDLAVAAARAGRDDWAAAARFFAQYIDVSDFQNATDYSDVVHRALSIVHDPDHARTLKDRYRLVVVDEYQDTDPLQVALLKGLAGGGRDLIAVGDPDQSIYAFRGADVGGIMDFPQAFAVDGRPADVLALRSTRRFGEHILAASRGVIAKVGVPGHLSAEAFAAFRHPKTLSEHAGEVIVETYATPAAEAEGIAQRLRYAHLHDGLPWTKMAVLVRSGTASIPRLQRALIAAGVPVEVAGDEVPLAAEPAVRTLLSALSVAHEIARGHPLDADQASAILAGPLCGLDATAMRRLGRALRAQDGDRAGGARPSRALIADALADPESFVLAAQDPRTVEAAKAARSMGRILAEAAVQIGTRTAPEQVLWTLWHGTGWDNRLREASDVGGDTAQRADRDLDALCALFDEAARFEERHQHRGVDGLVDALQGQQIPADTLFDRGTQHDAVRLMTAHRSKGLEWDLVVVAGVQEGTWPDIRYRGSFLQAERLSHDGQRAPASSLSLLAEERRLFYVAVTRAARTLVVTAVESGSESGDQPSRFLTELERHATASTSSYRGDDRHAAPLKRPSRPMSLRGMIAALRKLGEETDSAYVRSQVGAKLAELVEPGHYATRAADPGRWWGMRELTVNDVPMHALTDPIKLSGSAVSSIVDCPLNWFLAREARGGTATTTAQGFGSIVHALAAEVVNGEMPPDPAVMSAHLDQVWSQLEFQAPWIKAREREAAHEAITRFAQWHLANQRRPLAAEHTFKVELEVGGETVVLRGSMDRVEVAEDGRIHVVDFKTSKQAAATKDLAEHAQLGFYQVAVAHGAVSGLPGGSVEVGGAELVQLRNAASTRSPDFPKVQPQAAPEVDQPFFAYDQLLQAVRTIRTEDFAATPAGKSCTFCEFTSTCPAQPEGATILSGELL